MSQDGDGEEPAHGGLSEDAFDRLARVKMMDDATLLRAWRELSNSAVVEPSPWLPFLEAEAQARGLLTAN